MISLNEAVMQGTFFLEKQGVENPKLETQLILAHLLHCKPLELYLKRDYVLDLSIQKKFDRLLQRRATREPLQYILGQTHFLDLVLKTDARALIPRPETEMLVESIVDLCKTQPDSVLELGVGSGAILLTLAKKFPRSRLVGIDCSQETLDLTKENIVAQKLISRVELFLSHWFNKVKGKFDLIVANPPYLSEEDYRQSAPEVHQYEPKQALVSENKGLADLLKIIADASAYLTPYGVLALETGIEHHEMLQKKGIEMGYKRHLSLKDLNGHNRFFFLWV